MVVVRFTHEENIHPHSHDAWEMAWVLSGEAIHKVDKVAHRIGAGTVVILHPQSAHGYEECRELRLVNVMFTREILQRMRRDLGEISEFHTLFPLSPTPHRFAQHLHLSPEEMDEGFSWVNKIDEETRIRSRGGNFVAESYLIVLIAFMSRIGRHESLESPGIKQSKLAAAISWIDANLHQVIRVEQIAQRATLSTRSLNRAFKAQTGSSPRQYILNARLALARRLISQNRPILTMTQVAEASGLGHANYLSRQMKAKTGKPPSAYRTS